MAVGTAAGRKRHGQGTTEGDCGRGENGSVWPMLRGALRHLFCLFAFLFCCCLFVVIVVFYILCDWLGMGFCFPSGLFVLGRKGKRT